MARLLNSLFSRANNQPTVRNQRLLSLRQLPLLERARRSGVPREKAMYKLIQFSLKKRNLRKYKQELLEWRLLQLVKLSIDMASRGKWSVLVQLFMMVCRSLARSLVRSLRDSNQITLVGNHHRAMWCYTGVNAKWFLLWRNISCIWWCKFDCYI